MTLCLAWKEGNSVRVMSDSRLNAEKGMHYDYYCKIVPAIARIDSEASSYYHVWALAYAGDFIIGNVLQSYTLNFLSDIRLRSDLVDIKQIIEQLTQNYDCIIDDLYESLWISDTAHVPEIEITIDGSGNLPKDIEELLPTMKGKRERTSSLLIAGYCPSSGSIRAFCWHSESGTEECFKEEKLEAGYSIWFHFIGKFVANAARCLSQNHKPIETFNRMMNDVTEIGGSLTGGEFIGQDFHLCSVNKPPLTPITGQTKSIYPPQIEFSESRERIISDIRG